MATGQPLRAVLRSPAEMAMWERFLDRRPPGDPILRELLADFCVMAETFLTDPKAQPRKMTAADWDRYYRWHFWKKRPDDLPTAEQQEQDELKVIWGDAYETMMAETNGY